MRPIRRPAALLALCWALASCGTRSGPPAPDVHAVRPPPEICAAAPAAPAIPDAAGIPAPVTDLEEAAVDAFLNWVAQLVDHDGALVTRAAKTKTWCDQQG